MNHRKLQFLIATPVAGLVAIEVVLRLLAGPEPTRVRYSPVPGVLYALKPNQKWTEDFIDRVVSVDYAHNSKVVLWKSATSRVNSFGFRGDDFTLESLKSKQVILCLGDSLTYGQSVEDQYTYPQLLQNVLLSSGKRGIWSINTGVSSYNLWEYAANLRYYLPLFHPKVVVVGLCMNDNISRSLIDKLDYVLNHELIVYSRIHGAYVRLKERIQSTPAFINYAVHQNQDATSQAAFLEYLHRMKDPSSAAAVMVSMMDIPAWRKALDNIGEMDSLCKRSHAKLVIVIFPTIFQIKYGYREPEPQATLCKYLETRHIAYCDMRPVFRLQMEKGVSSFLTLWDCFHFNPYGYALIARSLYDKIQADFN